MIQWPAHDADTGGVRTGEHGGQDTWQRVCVAMAVEMRCGNSFPGECGELRVAFASDVFSAHATVERSARQFRQRKECARAWMGECGYRREWSPNEQVEMQSDAEHWRLFTDECHGSAERRRIHHHRCGRQRTGLKRFDDPVIYARRKSEIVGIDDEEAGVAQRSSARTLLRTGMPCGGVCMPAPH